MSEPVRRASDRLKDFLFAEVYGRDVTGIVELEQASETLRQLFRFYMEHPEGIVDITGAQLGNDIALRTRQVCDLISSMTDRYAQKDYAAHFPGGAISADPVSSQ